MTNNILAGECNVILYHSWIVKLYRDIMKKELRIAASLLLCLTPALAEDAKRELGAHEHGL